MKQQVPHSRPWIGSAERNAISRVLASRQLASGREVARLEAEFAERVGIEHAIAVSSGTAALHISLVALGIGPADRVIIPTYVCASVLNAVRYVGASESIVDCGRGSFHLDAAAPATGRAVAVIVPHMFGYRAPVQPFLDRNLTVIEDCAMSLGSTDAKQRPLGQSGKAATYSFYATKTLAGGEGGMVTTNDPALAEELRDLRSYDKRDRWRLRFNYKMTDITAALLRCQLRRLSEVLERRRVAAEYYFEALKDTALRLPPERKGASYFRFVPRITSGYEGAARRLEARGIETPRPVHIPLHRALEIPGSRFPRAERLFSTAISLPIYPTITRRELKHVVSQCLGL